MVKSPDFELKFAALQFVELLCRVYPPGIAILVEMDIVDILEAHQFSDHEVRALVFAVSSDVPLRFGFKGVSGRSGS